MNNEKLIFEVIAKSKGKSQMGDVSKHLKDQKFFDDDKIPKGLKRDKQLSGGNPIDTLDDFLRQNPD